MHVYLVNAYIYIYICIYMCIYIYIYIHITQLIINQRNCFRDPSRWVFSGTSFPGISPPLGDISIIVIAIIIAITRFRPRTEASKSWLLPTENRQSPADFEPQFKKSYKK